MGSPLKISRPHDYMPLEAVQSLLTPAAAAASASSPGVSSSAPVTVLKPSRYVALGNVVAPEELGVAEECSFVAEDTKAKFETEYGTVEHVFVVMSAKVQALALSSLAARRALLLTAVSFPGALQEGCSSVAAMVVPGVIGHVVVAFHDMHAGAPHASCCCRVCACGA